MDGGGPTPLEAERRRRLAAERMLETTRRELQRAHAALVANADRLSRDYLSERAQNARLTERQARVLAQRRAEAKRADRARQRLWHALETMRDGFALFDADDILIAANRTWLALFDCADGFGPGDTAEAIFRQAAEEGAFDFGEGDPEAWIAGQLARRAADPVAPQLLHHYDGRRIRLVERRALDGDLVSLAVDVTEDEARIDALDRARTAAEATARAKSDFLARMSHEIRTPMNGVIGMADMLADGAADEDARLCARTIRDSAEALLVIVNDTLDVSKLEAGRMELREAPFDLEALLRDCLRLARAGVADAPPVALGWQLDLPRRVTGDAGRVRQIVMNLLSNALKFTGDGPVTVAARSGDGGLRITVADSGPGIPDGARATIFEAFAQVDAPELPAKEGTGLGLTISRGLARRMGGELSLDPEAGPGARFILDLPLSPAEAAPALPALPRAVELGPGAECDALAETLAMIALTVTRGAGRADRPLIARPQDVGPAAPQPILLATRREVAQPLALRAQAVLTPPAGAQALLDALATWRAAPVADAPDDPAAEPGIDRPPRLLAADDNATNRLLLERMLRDTGFAVEVVEDGERAVAAFRAARPDIVVLDISMPVMDGFAARAAIAAADDASGAPPVPCIALTAHAGEDMAARLREAGFVAHLTKPLKKPVLLEAIAAARSSVPR